MDLPVKGVVGVLGGDAAAVAAVLDSLSRPSAASPDAVEVRGDLFESPRAALDALHALPRGLPAIFTVRLPSHGGKFAGDEEVRLGLYREALARGAALVDAEGESDAARALAREGAPLIASHHDLGGMPAPAEIARLTRAILDLGPRAIKLVPTAGALADALAMLDWVAAARPGEPPRIGFAMGEAGLPGRVLSLSRGAPFTYASFGGPVAPGQPSVADLKTLYRAARIGRATRVLGVAGNPVAHSLSPHIHNPALAARGIDAVYLPFRLGSLSEAVPALDPLRIDGLSVTVPFKEEALRLADEADGRARSAGAANTLVVRREGGSRTLHAYNTDFEGVLGPLRRRGIDPAGLPAAIIGNGGAARGAARALIDAGATVTIYFRDPSRGGPVAAALGAAGLPLERLERGRQRLIVNATPLGLHENDPSPVPAGVFDGRTVAFDMVYGPPGTPFLEAARAGGAGATIGGAEMLVAQAIEQFRLFTGRDVTLEELEGHLREAERRRGSAPAS
jgi:3-dehydroquinate dehydratase/shikimate dehydrogenase